MISKDNTLIFLGLVLSQTLSLNLKSADLKYLLIMLRSGFLRFSYLINCFVSMNLLISNLFDLCSLDFHLLYLASFQEIKLPVLQDSL